MAASARVGLVTAVPSAGTVEVTIGALDPVPVAAAAHLADVTVGTVVLVITDSGQSWAVAAVGSSAAPVIADMIDPDVPIEQARTVTGTDVVAPWWAGTWRAGAWREDTQALTQGDLSGEGINQGCAFVDLSGFGRVQSARVTWTRTVSGSGEPVAPGLVLYGPGDPDIGIPAVIGSTTSPAMAPGETTSFDLPASWVEQLQDGRASGFGISGGGFVQVDDVWIEIEWERTS